MDHATTITPKEFAVSAIERMQKAKTATVEEQVEVLTSVLTELLERYRKEAAFGFD